MNGWDKSQEDLISRYADECVIRESLHREMYFAKSCMLKWFQIPAILFSSLSGSLQFLSKSFPSAESTIITCTGALSVLTAFISSIAAFLKIAEAQTRHYAAECGWQQLSNTIRHQLSLAPGLRVQATDFVLSCEQSYRQLFEVAPIIEKRYIVAIKRKVRKNATPDFEVPAIFNGWKHAFVYGRGEEWEENTEPSA